MEDSSDASLRGDGGGGWVGGGGATSAYTGKRRREGERVCLLLVCGADQGACRLDGAAAGELSSVRAFSGSEQQMAAGASPRLRSGNAQR